MKTFQVSLRQPFGAVTRHPYSFLLPADSREDALYWVARTFPGIDINPTLRRWAIGKTTIGNTDPVAVTALKTPEVDIFKVAQDFEKILNRLRNEHWAARDSYTSMFECYPERARPWMHERLLAFRRTVELSWLWQKNLHDEYMKLPLPELADWENKA